LPFTVSNLILIPSAFSASGSDLLAQELVGCRYEVVPAEAMDGSLLRIDRRSARGQDGGNAASAGGRSGGTPRELQ
jgi:hypothetical protein